MPNDCVVPAWEQVPGGRERVLHFSHGTAVVERELAAESLAPNVRHRVNFVDLVVLSGKLLVHLVGRGVEVVPGSRLTIAPGQAYTLAALAPTVLLQIYWKDHMTLADREES